MNVCHMNVCHMLFLVVKASVQDEHLIRQFSVAKPMPQAYHVGMILYPPQSDWGWFTNGPQAPVRITELSRDRIAKTGYAKAYSSAFATKRVANWLWPLRLCTTTVTCIKLERSMNKRAWLDERGGVHGLEIALRLINQICCINPDA